MYLKEISEIDFQLKKRKTTPTNYNRELIITPSDTDVDIFDSCHLDLAFKKFTTSKKRKNNEIDKVPSSISKPAKNAKIFYSKYDNYNSSISKPNLL
jgi:hypothetical protein